MPRRHLLLDLGVVNSIVWIGAPLTKGKYFFIDLLTYNVLIFQISCGSTDKSSYNLRWNCKPFIKSCFNILHLKLVWQVKLDNFIKNQIGIQVE